MNIDKDNLGERQISQMHKFQSKNSQLQVFLKWMIKGIKENLAQDMKTYKSYYTKIWNVAHVWANSIHEKCSKIFKVNFERHKELHIYFSLKLEKFIVQYKYLIPVKNVM